MLQSVIFGALAALGWGVADTIVALTSRRLGTLTLIVWVHVSSVALGGVFLIFVASFAGISAGQWAALVSLALLALVTYLAFYKALQTGPIAIVSPIVSAYAVVVILMASFLAGERLSGLQIIAVTGTIAGIVVASLDLSRTRSLRALVSRGVLLGIVAMIGIGVWQYFLGILSRDLGWFVPIFVSRTITLAVILPAWTMTKERRLHGLTFGLALAVFAAGAAEMGGFFAFARGAEIGIISLVAASSTVYPVIPIVGGLLLFRERLHPVQVFGLAVALSGLGVLAFFG